MSADDLDGAVIASLSRRQWLTFRAVLDGAPVLLAMEAVATTALEHPEWDMDETRTWVEWEET